TGERLPTPDGAEVAKAPLNGPRAIDFDKNGEMWLALREGNAIYEVDSKPSSGPSEEGNMTGRVHHVAGTGEQGFGGNGGPAKLATLSGPKGISIAPGGDVYFTDTESHSIRMIDVHKGTVELVAGTGERGDGPDGDPLKCRLARPHGIVVDADGSILIGDSE